jgi:hypothetical protein
MKRAIIFINIILSVHIVLAQAKTSEIPLLKYLQENFDSTVVYSIPVSTSYRMVHYNIVSKKDNKFAYFTYFNPYFYSLADDIYPIELQKKFAALYIEFHHSLPDTNKFFFPFNVPYQKRDEVWKAIQTNNCWSIKDDIAEPEICKERGNYLIEGSGNQFYLITKTSTKKLYFLTPELDEQYCSKNNNRQQILKIIQSFNSIFNNDR